MNLKKLVHFLMGLLIAAYPLANFQYKVFRGISCHFFHHFEKVAPFTFKLPALFQKYMHFYFTDFLIIVLVIGLYLLKQVRLKEFFFNPHSRYLTLYTFAALLSILCSLFSKYFFQYTTLINLTLAFFSFHLVYTLYKNRIDLISLTLWAFLAVAALECFIGIGQFIMQHDLGLYWLSEPSISPSMDNIAVFHLQEGRQFLFGILPWIPENHNLILRAHGTFDHPNIFGGYLTTSLFVAYYAFITSDARWKRGLLLVLIPVQILTLTLTFGRGSFFAWVIGTLMFFSLGLIKKTLFSKKAKKQFLRLGILVGVGCVLTLTVLFNYLNDRGGFINYNALSNASDTQRFVYYRIASLLFLRSPIIGIGFNGFSLFPYGLLQPELEGVNANGSLAHNIYLQTAAETGIVGLLFLILFIVSLYKPYRKMPFTPLSLTLGTIFFSLLLIGLVDHFLVTYTSGRLLFFLFAGLFAACANSENAEKKIEVRSL